MGAAGGAWSTDPQIALKSYFTPQGIGADTIATKYGFSRDDVDAFAVESQRRAAQAWKEGRFKKSVVPVRDQMGGIRLAHDEFMRPDTTMQTLAALEPSFAGMGGMGFDEVIKQRYPELEKINHVHHAGNSSGIVDGASAVLFGSEAMGKATGMKPRARVRAMASIGSEPGIMLTGPTYVTQKVLKKAGMTVEDIDLFELNEAFAAQLLQNIHAAGIPEEKVNVAGGAIALGHPIGGSGARCLVTLIHQLIRTGGKRGVVALCLGGGNAVAMVIEV
jgi:acetyl-CoA C-acetyltransferase